MPANEGSASHWGPLFGARATTWAETWEGSAGWGTPLYQHVLERVAVGSGTRVLDCGCGAGRFARMATDRGARVAGIDASEALIEIARERTREGDFRVGDIEALPWEDDSFDAVTGFSAFQFAQDKVRALREAARQCWFKGSDRTAFESRDELRSQPVARLPGVRIISPLAK